MQRAEAVKLIAALALFLSLAGCSHVSADKASTVPEEISNPYLGMMLARYEEDQGNWNRALELYSKIDDPYATLAQARINFILNRQEEALRHVDKVIASNTHVDEALELRTKIYARKGDWHQAIADTEVLAGRYPENSQLKLFLANLKIIVSDYKGAEKILRSLIGTGGDDSMILYTLSKACLGDKNLPCARDALQKVIDKNPKFVSAYLDLGKTYEMSKESRKAESLYRKVLELEPDSVDALVSLTDLYISTSRYKDAIDQLVRLRQINDDVQIIRKLSILQLQEEKFEDALASLKSIREPTMDDSYYIAITYAKLGRLEDGLEALKDISVSSRLGCETAMLRSSLLKDLGRQEETISELSAAWEYFMPKGTCMEVGYQLATELDTAGRRDEGMAIAQKLLEKNPDDPVALNLVGYVWADRGINLDKAHKMIREALKARPDDPYIMDSMAWVLHKQGDHQKALEYLKKAVEKLDTDATIHEHMGDVLRSMGKKKKALDYYLKARSLSKKPREELLRKIEELSR